MKRFFAALRLYVVFTFFAVALVASHAPAAEAPKSRAAAKLNFALNDKGLASLNYGGQELLGPPPMGEMQPASWTTQETRALGAVEKGSAVLSSALDAAKRKLTLTFSWGTIVSVYTQRGDRLEMKVTATNSTTDKKLTQLVLQIAELQFPQVPLGGTLDVGMFGYGYRGDAWPLHSFPLVATPLQQPPLIVADYGSGALAYSSTDFSGKSYITVPRSSNAEKTAYPFWVTLAEDASPLLPQSSRTATVSLRFGAASTRAA